MLLNESLQVDRELTLPIFFVKNNLVIGDNLNSAIAGPIVCIIN